MTDKPQTQTIPLFPLRTPLHPQGLLSLQIFEVRYLDMVKKAVKDKTPFGVVLLTDGEETQRPGRQEAMAEIGTLANIIECNALQPALLHILCLGGQRFALHSTTKGKYGLWMGEVSLIEDPAPQPLPAAHQKAADRLGALIAELQRQGIAECRMPLRPPYRLDEAGWVANRWAEILPFDGVQRQQLLEEDDELARLDLLMGWMGDVFDDTP